MNVFFTADLHFGHGPIRIHCARPFDTIEAMDAAMVERWNDAVGRRDLVYILGDFAWKRHASYLGQLRGKKILIRGNHDRMSQECLRNFTEVHDLLFRTFDKQPIMLSHYCMLVWRSSCHGAWHLYGHSHGRIRERQDTPRCDVGVDVWGFRPVPWEAVRLKLEARQSLEYGDAEDIEAAVELNRTENLGILERIAKDSVGSPKGEHTQ